MATTAAQLDVRFTSSGAESVRSDLRGLEDATKAATSGFDQMAAKVQQFDAEIRDVGQMFAAFGAVTTAAVGLGVRNFVSLEAAMANVNSIAGQTDAQLAATTQQVRDLAVQMGSSPTDLAEGLYDIVSSGFDAAEGMQVLEAAAVAARAGLTSTGTAAQAITAVLNAYGRGAEDAADVSDVLFKTVDSGVITFEELAGSMGRVLPLANTLQVGIEDLGAAYAELTLQGLNASEAETGLSAIMTAAINPTEALAEAVREYGYESAEALIQTEGFAAFLEFLGEASGGSASGMSELTGNVRATNAALILAQDGASGFIERLTEMENAGGRTGEVFAVQMATVQGSIDRARAAFGDLGITVGAAVAPMVDLAATAAGIAAVSIGNLPEEMQMLAGAGIAAAGGVALVAGGVLLLLPRIIETVRAFQTLRAAMVATGAASALLRLTPIGIALAGIAAVGGLVAASWLEQNQAAAEYNSTLTTLEQSLEMVRRQGDESLAALGTSAKDTVEELRQSIAEFDDIELPDPADFRSDDPFDTGYGEALAEVENQIADIQAQAELAGPALDALNAALNDPTVDADAYFRWANGLLEAAAATEDVTDDIEALNAIIATQDEMPTEFLRAYADDAEAAAESTNLLEQAIGSQMETVGNAREQVNGYIEALALWNEQNREVSAAIREIAGWDNALSQLNLAGLAGDMGLFAEEGIRAGQALDNTFRIIVGNTNAIIQQVEGVQSWADELINVRGELGLIDDLLAGGFIDLDTYIAAQEAYDAIAGSVEQVRNNLLAVQAMQAPFIAEQIEGTAAWAEELRNMDAEAQRVALSFMDLQTVTQAQEIIALANTDAFRAMGTEGEAAFEAMIQGALQTNPLLFNVLETMGIISGTPLDFDVDFDALADAGGAMDRLITSVEHLVDTLREIHGLPPIEVDAEVSGNAEEELLSIEGAIGELAGRSVEVQVHAALNQAAGDLAGGGSLLAGGLNAALGIPDEVNVGVKLSIQQGSAAVGDGTGGAGNWSAMLGVPESVEVPVTPVADGEVTAETLGVPESVDLPVVPTVEGEVTTASLGIPESIEIPVTLNLDATALNPFGLGFADGGGAAGYTPMTAYIDVAIGENELDGYTPPTFDPVMIDVATDGALLAIENLNGVANAAREATALGVSITVNAPGSDIVKGALDDVTAAANAIPEAESVTVSTPGALVSALSLGAVRAAAEAIPDAEQVAVSVVGAETAVNSLNAVANAAASIPASVSTTITTNRVTTFSTIGSPISAFADGGYVRSPLALVGEEGPELVQLPYGSFVHTAEETARLLANRSEGIAPARTTAGGTATTGGGITLNIDVHGNVYGVDDLTAEIAGPLVAAMAEENRRHRAAQGVMA